MNVKEFYQSVEQIGLQLSSEQLAAFEQFEEALYEANEVMNLTRVPREECAVRHFLDSLLFQDLIPKSSHVLDIGTGPGFPAWPLAVARPDLQVTAVDSSSKMLGFLSRMRRTNLTLVNGRAEAIKGPSSFGFITGRAVAPLSTQLEISARPCVMGGLVVPMRSSSDLDSLNAIDLTPLGLKLEGHELRELADTGVIRLFPIYKKIQPTQRGFPRGWAELKSKPL